MTHPVDPIRLCRALEEALHTAGDSMPITHATRLTRDGALDRCLHRYGLAIVDTRPHLPTTRKNPT